MHAQAVPFAVLIYKQTNICLLLRMKRDRMRPQYRRKGEKMDCSYKAQVSAVFDMDGHIHPRWLRFRNSLGEVVTVEKLTVEEEGPTNNLSLRSFRCSTYMYGRRQEFCLCYSINSHSWTIEYRSTEAGYRYLLSKDRREFS